VVEQVLEDACAMVGGYVCGIEVGVVDVVLAGAGVVYGLGRRLCRRSRLDVLWKEEAAVVVLVAGVVCVWLDLVGQFCLGWSEEEEEDMEELFCRPGAQSR